MRYRKPVIIEKPTCGKTDRCKHSAACPYLWQPVLSGLCFERKPEPKKVNKRYRKDDGNADNL